MNLLKKWGLYPVALLVGGLFGNWVAPSKQCPCTNCVCCPSACDKDCNKCAPKGCPKCCQGTCSCGEDCKCCNGCVKFNK